MIPFLGTPISLDSNSNSHSSLSYTLIFVVLYFKNNSLESVFLFRHCYFPGLYSYSVFHKLYTILSRYEDEVCSSPKTAFI